MRDKKVELLACAIWAKEKCTTNFGIDIDVWLKMHKEPKAMWIAKAREHLKRGNV